MKVKILEYKRYKCSHVKVRSHSRCKGKWKVNKKFALHKRLVSDTHMYPVTYVKEYEVNLE